jgi:pimeloyl-ACP methyl ester carboxylesterase
MHANRHLIFIHGLMGSSQGVKASLLRRLYPDILTPDFSGSLEERMAQLEHNLGEEKGWTMIGSSLGGLMAVLFARQHTTQVSKLILLAPALTWPDFMQAAPSTLDIPTLIYHGIRDELVPVDKIRRLAEQIFTQLDFHMVDDDHGLYKTVHTIDWQSLV